MDIKRGKKKLELKKYNGKKYKDITKELWNIKYPKHYEFYKWLMEDNKGIKI